MFTALVVSSLNEKRLNGALCIGESPSPGMGRITKGSSRAVPNKAVFKPWVLKARFAEDIWPSVLM